MMQETCYRKLINAYQDKQDGFIVFNKHKMRTTQILKEIEYFALSLKSLGFKTGDTLTLFLPTCPQAIVAFYACSKLGIVANIVHPLMTLDQLAQNLTKTKSKGLMFYDILVKDHRELEKINQILINCSVADYTLFRKGLFKIYAKAKRKTSKVSLHYKQLIRKVAGGGPLKPTKEAGKADSIVTTMHSGGTSSTPKIVCLSNHALNELCDNLFIMYTRIHPVGKNECSLVALPIFHAYGLGVSIHTCLCNHYNLILVPKINARKINKLIKFYNVTFMAGVPVMFKKMMEEHNFEGKHLKKLKDLWCGGDVVPETLLDQFNVLPT